MSDIRPPPGVPAVYTVPFHGHDLQLVDHGGEPFVVMRPLVAGLGLAWPPQFRKLQDNAGRWGVINLITPSAGGSQASLCMPLRKLPAYLFSIEPHKVRDTVRPVIELFQQECDDALWAYWNQGIAVRPGARPPAAAAPARPPEFAALATVALERLPRWQELRDLHRRGLTPGQMAQIIGFTPTVIKRELATLQACGLLDTTRQEALPLATWEA